MQESVYVRESGYSSRFKKYYQFGYNKCQIGYNTLLKEIELCIMKTEHTIDIKNTIEEFILATNAFDVDRAIGYFAKTAIIDDVSVGDTFERIAGVRRYLQQFFVGYNTVTKLESIEIINAYQAKVKVDFTGNFGHETGGLDVTINTEGLITKVDAYLD